MPGIQNKSPECQKPGCRNNREETYKDEHGNKVRVCEKCYYRLVVRQKNVTLTGTMNPLITPSSSSNKSLYEMSKETLRDVQERNFNSNIETSESYELKVEE